MASSIVAGHDTADQSPVSADIDSLVDVLCEKAKHLDVLLTLMHSGAHLELGEEGQADLLWLASNLAAEAGNTARQIQGPTAL